MESTFFHLSAEKIQWLDMEWMQAGARSPQFPGDRIHSVIIVCVAHRYVAVKLQVPKVTQDLCP